MPVLCFFTGVATVKEDSELWKIMKNKFGPIRSTINDYPEIAGTNVFIGKYLRIELLYRQGLFEEVIKEIKRSIPWYGKGNRNTVGTYVTDCEL